MEAGNAPIVFRASSAIFFAVLMVGNYLSFYGLFSLLILVLEAD